MSSKSRRKPAFCCGKILRESSTQHAPVGLNRYTMDNPNYDAVIPADLSLCGRHKFVNHSRDWGVNCLRSDDGTGKVDGAEYL